MKYYKRSVYFITKSILWKNWLCSSIQCFKSEVTSQAFTVIYSNNSTTLNPVSSVPGYSPIDVTTLKLFCPTLYCVFYECAKTYQCVWSPVIFSIVMGYPGFKPSSKKMGCMIYMFDREHKLDCVSTLSDVHTMKNSTQNES